MTDTADSTTWGERYTRTIAAQIRHHRKARGLSCQQLSDACTQLGHPIPRPVLSYIELGRRENIAIAELFTIARALNVPPLALMLADDITEIGDGQFAPWDAAAAWIAGLPSPGALSTLAVTLSEAQSRVEAAWMDVTQALSTQRVDS